MRNLKGISLGTERRCWSRIGRLARAALAGLGDWSNSVDIFPAAPRALAEPLEARQLLSFTVSIAAPPTVTATQQFYIYVWTAGGTMLSSDEYSVDFGDGLGTHQFAWNPNSRVTAIAYTYANGGTTRSIVVTATGTVGQGRTTACQSVGMEALGNYPDQNGGPTAFVPSGADSATPSAILVDPGTGGAGYTYVAETYSTSGGGHQMALTRLDSNDLPDTTWGTHVSGSTPGKGVISLFLPSRRFSSACRPAAGRFGCPGGLRWRRPSGRRRTGGRGRG